MSWSKKVLGIIASLFVIVVILGLTLPSNVHVERKILINAQPQAIYPLISNFEEWNKWSPWAKLDPDAEFTLEGQGLNQKMSWSSEDSRVGKGSEEIVAMDEPNSLKTHLDCLSKSNSFLSLTTACDKVRICLFNALISEVFFSVVFVSSRTFVAKSFTVSKTPISISVKTPIHYLYLYLEN